jgi:hypothetical protein
MDSTVKVGLFLEVFLRGFGVAVTYRSDLAHRS